MNILTADNIPTTHGFFTRQGGVSQGIYASLNCGVGSNDDNAHVSENLERVRDALGADHLQTLYQVHSATCVEVSAPLAHDDRPQADAMITDVRGLALGVLTADCTPVLFNLDSYSDEEKFFSYRRKTHRNEADYGRQISCIVIK